MWTADSGRSYRLCLLDTNTLSEILKRPATEGRGFIERFPPSSHVPCFTPYNLIELRRRPDLFQAFLNFFTYYPSFITQPHQAILAAERESGPDVPAESILLRAFTPFGADLRQFITSVFADPGIANAERDWRKNNQDALDTWLSRKANFSRTSPVANAKDAKHYVNDAAIDTLIQLDPEWVKDQLATGHTPAASRFPSLQVMLYSQYYRLFDPHWQGSSQDVTDVCIVACAPYVDTIVTENFQAEILRKICRRIPRMENLEVATLRDIR